MKIISPFKDYYDYLSYQYGIDNNIVYTRPNIIILDKEYSDIDKKKKEDIIEILKTYCGYTSISMYIKDTVYKFWKLLIFDKIIFCVKQYSLNSEKYIFRIAKQTDFIQAVKLLNSYNKTNYIQIYNQFDMPYIKQWANNTSIKEKSIKSNFIGYLRYNNRYESDRIGCLNISDKYTKNIIYDTQKFLKQPIILEYNNDVNYGHIVRIPNLSQIQGISGIINPNELYKNLTNFFIDIKDSVDTKPPVEISNKDKIVKAGFDTKSSFRHPIK